MRPGCDLLQSQFRFDALKPSDDCGTLRRLRRKHPQTGSPDLGVVGCLVSARVREEGFDGRVGEQGIPQPFTEFAADLDDPWRG